MESWEFGRMVRSWRERVAPEMVGMPAGTRRRAPGLRREELSALAGISADYLTRLEQGRATSPSAQVVEALARSLRLADGERDVLYRLAGHATPGPEVVPTRIPSSVQRLLDRFANIPVAVYDASNTLVVANLPYDALMGDTSLLHGYERNAVWRYFVGNGSRAVLSPEETDELESRLVADLRVTQSRYPSDRALTRLVDELTTQSQRFGRLWKTTDFPTSAAPARHKTIDHPSVGPIGLDCDILIVAVDDLRIMVYTAEPGTVDADRLALALVLGTQSLVG